MSSTLAPPRLARLRPAHGLRPLVSLPPLLLVCLFFHQLGARDLVSSHEARAAQNAQRMLDTGEWGLPTLFDGQRDLQKPPGFYWLVAAVGKLNGGRVEPWVARFPASAAALATVLLVYVFLRREGYTTAAVVGALVLASANHFVAIGRTARIDVPLTCAVAVSLVAFYRGLHRSHHAPRDAAPKGRQIPNEEPDTQSEGIAHHAERDDYRSHHAPRDAAPKGRAELPEEPRSSTPRVAHHTERDDYGDSPSQLWFLLSAIAAGFAVLLKGPVGLALVGTAAVAFLVAERLTCPPEARPRLPFPAAILGVLVTALVAVPWFVWANHGTDGEFVRVFFWHHNVSRFTGDSDALASHPWWYYGPRFALAFLPWTLLAPLVFWAFRSGTWRQDRLFRFGVVWAVVMVAVLSAAQFKRADYLLPAFPGAAIALGCAAERWLAAREHERSARRARWAFGALFAGALAVWPVMWVAFEPREAARQEKRPFAAAIRSHAPAPQPVLLFRTESHLLAFHLGSPLHTLVEWGDLKDALSAAGPHAVVMPPEYAADAERITGRRLVPVASLSDFTTVKPPRPLVCLRTAD